MKSIIYFAVGMESEEAMLKDAMTSTLAEVIEGEAQLIECDRQTMDFWFRSKMEEKSRMSDKKFIQEMFEQQPKILDEFNADVKTVKDSLEDKSAEFGYFKVVKALGCEYDYAKNFVRCAEALGFLSRGGAKNTFVFVDDIELALQAVINKIEGLKQSLLLMNKFKEMLERGADYPKASDQE